MKKISTFFLSALLLFLTLAINTNAQNGCDSWIPRDNTFSYAPFTDGTPPYYRNDDGSTNPIALPFNFCFWNQTYNSVYINNNGNISFGTPYATYSPDSFPSASFQMIAPFWGDVDTRNASIPGSNVVIYKIQPHYMIVQWDSVAYYTPSYNETDSMNSFQLIITDGTDPIIPRGNNVSFTYRTMHWTTGDASLGVNGYGGYPATVGANEGDNVRYVQIGLFDTSGSRYAGQFPPPPYYDGVAWLDYKTFYFNLCSGKIPPLVSGVSPCDTFKICVGDTLIIPFLYFSPAQNDSVWSNLAPPIPPGVSMYLNHPGHTDSLDIKIVGLLSNLGDHVVNVYGYDNENPPDTTYTSFVVEIDMPPALHAHSSKDSICVGDTSVLSATGAGYYSWSNGKTTSSISVNPATTESYTLSATNGGCVKDTVLKVTVLPIPRPTITATPDSTCVGDSVLLTGSGGKDYLWSNGERTSSIKVAPVATTTYTLVASNGICGDTAIKTVKIIPDITATISAVHDTVCPHGTTTITAKGIGRPVTYLWNNGDTASSITVSDTVTTTYTVTVQGPCNSVQQVMQVNVVPLPKPLIMGSNWKCIGQNDTLTVTSSTNPTTYLWYNGSKDSTIITGEINADSIVHVTAYNSLGCPVTIIDTILLRQPPAVTTNPPTIFCAGQPLTLSANASGTYPPFTYKWSTGQTGSSITIDPGPDSATVYTVYASNGCTGSAQTTVIPNVPILNACCNQILTIEHDSANRHDTTILVAQGNSTKYQWQEQPTTGTLTCLDPLCDSVQVITDVTTTYTVTGTDSNGCQTEQLLLVSIDIPCFNLIVPNVFTPTNAGTLGVDDRFYIRTENIDGWDLTIFDRWGKEVYHSTNPYQYWNGVTESGSNAAEGVYYYVIKGTCQNVTYEKDGFVQLIR